MPIYSLRNRTTNVTIANPCLEIITPSTYKAKIMEIGLFLAAATASVFGLGRPAAMGITPTTPVTVLAEDPESPAGHVQTALAWATSPTVPGNFFRSISLPATIGTGIIWSFPRGLIIPISFSMVIWNISAVGVADIYVVLDEILV